MSEVLRDVRFALRMLRRGWVVTSIAVLSLAVSIGGNTAVFGLINTFLFQPISIDEPDRVVFVQERTRDQPAILSTLTVSLAMVRDLDERSRAISDWAAIRPTVVGFRDGERAEPVSAAAVTESFFGVIGENVYRGRAFLAEEVVPGGRKVAIVTPSFWERIRGGEGDPVGTTLTLDGEPVEVVGVTPEDFAFPFTNADIWIPLTDAAAESPRDRRDVFALGRMAPGATMEQVGEEVRSIAAALESEHPEIQRNWTADVFNARFDIPDARTKMFYGLLQGSVFFVLLIACANIANLLMARAQERRREMALRSALGAGKGRLLRQLMTESGLLVGFGAVLGLAFGWIGLRAMANRFANLLPPSYTPSLDGATVAFTVGVSIAAGLAFGLAPALQSLRTSHSETLKEGGGKATGGKSRKLVARGLVVAEIALSLVALGGGGMLVRSFLELRSADPGFDGSSLVTARPRVPASKYPSEEERLGFLDQILERTMALEGAEHAALINALPRNFAIPTDTFALPGVARDATQAAPRAFALKASPGYVAALEIAILQGRFFDDSDRWGSTPVAVVNRSWSEAWFPAGDAVGRFVHFDGASRQIVGVVEDVQQVLVTTPGQVASEAIYTPAAQSPLSAFSVVVSSPADPALLKQPMRQSLTAIDPDLTLSQLLTMEEVVDQFFAGIDVFNTILGGFGFLAILLASLGTYGVLSHQVSQRRSELGIRMAIGARSAEVLRMVTRQGVGMALVGLALGGLALVPLSRLVSSLLDGFVSVRTDTGLYVALVLFAVTLVATVVPAMRAAGLDPAIALRDD